MEQEQSLLINIFEAYKFALSVKALEEVGIPGPLYLSWFLLGVVVLSDVD